MTQKNASYCLKLDEDDSNLHAREFYQQIDHDLTVETDSTINDVYLKFSTRLALYHFGLSLIHEAFYGLSGMQERVSYDGFASEGLRLTNESSRLFIFYPPETPLPSDYESLRHIRVKS